MWGTRYDSAKLKTNLKLAQTRIQMLQKKKANMSVNQRKDIAELISKNKLELARVRVEQIIRDDYLCDVYEMIEIFCALLVSRFSLVDNTKHCDNSIREAVATLMWAGRHLEGEVSEFKVITSQFTARYGKEFAQLCIEDVPTGLGGAGDHWVSQRVRNKLEIHQLEQEVVEGYMISIAAKFEVEYTPVAPPIAAGVPEAFGAIPSEMSAANGWGPTAGAKGTEAGAASALDAMFPGVPGTGSAGSGIQMSSLSADGLFPPAAGAGGPQPPMYPPEPPAPSTSQGAADYLDVASTDLGGPRPQGGGALYPPPQPEVPPPGTASAPAAVPSAPAASPFPKGVPEAEPEPEPPMPAGPPAVGGDSVPDFDELQARFNNLKAKRP